MSSYRIFRIGLFVSVGFSVACSEAIDTVHAEPTVASGERQFSLTFTGDQQGRAHGALNVKCDPGNAGLPTVVIHSQLHQFPKFEMMFPITLKPGTYDVPEIQPSLKHVGTVGPATLALRNPNGDSKTRFYAAKSGQIQVDSVSLSVGETTSGSFELQAESPARQAYKQSLEELTIRGDFEVKITQEIACEPIA